MANKRKRDNLDDSDSDEITPGKQILPVANLPHDFDQEPQDGMQYLFLVRRDARRLPHVTRAKNPYDVPENKVTHMPASPSTSVLPHEGWRIAFQTHFTNLRRNLIQATNVPQGLKPKVIPEKKNRDAWWIFLAGYPESEWRPMDKGVRKKLGVPHRARAFASSAEAVCFGNVLDVSDVQSGAQLPHLPTACLYSNFQQQQDFPDVVSESPCTVDLLGAEETGKLSPPIVTPSHLKEIDHRTSIHLLMYFTHWMNIHLQNPSDPMTVISIGHGQWVFALLTKIEDEVSADEMSLLRNLARACLGLIQGKKAASEGASDHVRISEASCWMIFAAIAGYWGQRDLWGDAETALAVGSDL